MDNSFVVVDGSNIATEGRSTPSLAQLDEAVRAFQAQYPGRQVIVVVDATFGHRIDPSEREAFDEAVAHGEIVSPPAGAIGRGDAFLLRVAERVGAQVLSNDSFREFHDDHPWLFDSGRLIGGTPVRDVGWIFTPRLPVKSARRRTTAEKAEKRVPSPTAEPAKKPAGRTQTHKAEKEAPAAKQPATKATTKKATKKAIKKKEPAPKRSVSTVKRPARVQKVEKKEVEKKPAAKRTRPESKAEIVGAKAQTPPKKPSGKSKPPMKAALSKSPQPRAVKSSTKGRLARAKGTAALPPVQGREVETAIEVATEEALVPGDAPVAKTTAGRGRRKRTGPPPAVNDPLTFLTFVSDHPIGSVLDGTVSSFTSHGAMVDVGEMHCYAPLAGLGRPAPAKARDVLERGQERAFVLVGLDPARRGAELALREVVDVGKEPADKRCTKTKEGATSSQKSREKTSGKRVLPAIVPSRVK